MTTNETTPKSRARELVSLVLLEAVGSSATAFVPLPFVDGYLFARLLRRIARKVIAKAGRDVSKPVGKAIVEGYLGAGASGLGEMALTAAARFVVRKIAVVLDVKKSHDVFGEAIAFALALDVAIEHVAVDDANARAVGGAVYRATQSLGSAALEVLTRAARDAFKASEGGEERSRFERVSEAIGKQVDEACGRLAHLMRHELARPAATR